MACKTRRQGGSRTIRGAYGKRNKKGTKKQRRLVATAVPVHNQAMNVLTDMVGRTSISTFRPGVSVSHVRTVHTGPHGVAETVYVPQPSRLGRKSVSRKYENYVANRSKSISLRKNRALLRKQSAAAANELADLFGSQRISKLEPISE
jgi:hypothetical protein